MYKIDFATNTWFKLSSFHLASNSIIICAVVLVWFGLFAWWWMGNEYSWRSYKKWTDFSYDILLYQYLVYCIDVKCLLIAVDQNVVLQLQFWFINKKVESFYHWNM